VNNVFAEEGNSGDKQFTAQSLPLLTASAVDAVSADDYITQDEGALLSASGPIGGVAEMTELQAQTAAGTISTYTVENGDTIASIATKYGISSNTILWANQLTRKSKIKVGQTLVILPISSVKHKVVKGDTIQKIAKKYHGDVDEIISYNGLEDGKLTAGEMVIIPDGEMPAIVVAPKAAKGKTSKYSGPEISGFFIHPAPGTRRSQGTHGHNGIDMAGAVGTPIRASAGGTVIVASSGGWGGGYGSYVVIKHSNGTQTLYGHLSRVHVSVGQSVDRGETIGLLGNTGRSTGPHLHFEIRGAKNPF
jgi:murein DD-endopeptidase MepM/ murein hydrolase activator NlpD